MYFAGITAQLAISSHLFNVGFSDHWCLRNIGLRVGKLLNYANATGFACDNPEIACLADALTPYDRWNCHRDIDGEEQKGGGFDHAEVRRVLKDLLDHVKQRTGHRPAKAQMRQLAAVGHG